MSLDVSALVAHLDACVRHLHQQPETCTFRAAGDSWSIAAVLSMASMFGFRHDQPRAAALYQKCLALCRELGDKRGLIGLLLSMGTATWLQSDYAQAIALYQECLALSRELGDRMGADGAGACGAAAG